MYRNLKTALPLSVVRAGEAAPLSAEDITRVHELLHRVYLAEDTRDPTALAQAVSQDFVQIHAIYGVLEGREQFVSWVIEHPEAFDGHRHQALNIATRAVGSDGAEAVSYIIVVQLFSDDPQAEASLPRIVGHGAVTDSLVKREGIWQLRRRVYDQFSLLPSYVPDEGVRKQGAQTREK